MLTSFKTKIAHEIAPLFGLPADKIYALFEVPKEMKHGHLSLPVFQLAKERKKAPPVIAQELSAEVSQKKLPGVERVEPVSGYVNFHLDSETVFRELMKFTASPERLGYSNIGEGKTVVIDYSSPNVAKPMHIGHLRATVIGQALRNLAETQGFKVIGLNHLGDWGSQFGKLTWAYQKWGHEFPFNEKPFESLYALYVKFHEEAEKHPEYEQAGAATFKRLEEGDAELVALWKKFVEISMADFEKQWARLGVRHDLVRGESFYNDRLDQVVRLLEEKGLLVESDGAMVVDLSDQKMPPCLIRKADGASLYATRDIASAIYRHDELKADVNLYVVGSDQALHFKQVFAVLEKMGFSWAKDCHHIGFGLVRFKDIGKISSRKGNIIRFSDIFDRAHELVLKIIAEKNPDLPNREKVAEQVAIGAIVFADLVNDRVKNVEFDWDRALSFEGDSGPYLQYCYVRCVSILRKAAESGVSAPESGWDSSVKTVPDSEVERELIKKLSEYDTILSNAYRQFRPNILANYLLDVCAAFNRFYHAQRILGGESELLVGRLALVDATRVVLKAGMGVLNMPTPEQM